MHHMLIAVATFVIAVLPLASHGQSAYPNKNIRVVVPSPTGGPSDLVARILGDKLSASLGKPVIVDNRPGASQIVGTATVAKAAPDGYTLLQAAANMAINPIMVPDLPFDTAKDFAPISMTHLTVRVHRECAVAGEIAAGAAEVHQGESRQDYLRHHGTGQPAAIGDAAACADGRRSQGHDGGRLQRQLSRASRSSTPHVG